MTDAIQFLDTSNELEIERAFAVFTYLRPHLDCAAFVQRVRAQREEGYKIIF